jgi:ParB family chromosome partitioning protein
MSKRALGKGLGALLGEATPVRSPEATQPERVSGPAMLGDREAIMVAVGDVVPNPNQPRKSINDNNLQELAASIRANGVLQPVLVRRNGRGYELVAGERRLRAARLAGLGEIPALVCTIEEAESMKLALLENIQRENLNPIEEAEAYRSIMERYGATHQELAGMLGKSRSTVTNMLRLLSLEQTLSEQVETGILSMGHARALLGVDDKPTRLRLARAVEKQGWSVRALEQKIQALTASAASKQTRPDAEDQTHDPDAAAVRELETRLQHHMGSPCRIRRRGERGRIEIEFFSNEELERVLERMGISPQL